jgi:hypothetical protein
MEEEFEGGAGVCGECMIKSKHIMHEKSEF